MWKNRDWLLHHDNAPARTLLVVRELLTKNDITTVPHPAYLPDLAPSEFYVFHKMKLRLKGWRFVSIEEIQAEAQQVLNTLMPADFNGCFQNGKIAGIVEYKPKVTTSKVTVEIGP
jgi:transposase